MLLYIVWCTRCTAEGQLQIECTGYTNDAYNVRDQVQGHCGYACLLNLARYQSTGLLANRSDRDYYSNIDSLRLHRLGNMPTAFKDLLRVRYVSGDAVVGLSNRSDEAFVC